MSMCKYFLIPICNLRRLQNRPRAVRGGLESHSQLLSTGTIAAPRTRSPRSIAATVCMRRRCCEMQESRGGRPYDLPGPAIDIGHCPAGSRLGKTSTYGDLMASMQTDEPSQSQPACAAAILFDFAVPTRQSPGNLPQSWPTPNRGSRRAFR